MDDSSTIHAVAMIRHAFGAEVRAARARVAMSQQDLADRANLSRSWLSGIERGTADPTLSDMQRIALALSLSLAELLRRAEE